MISLIDEETQYFVAESTKTVDLDDAEKYDDPEDAIWADVGAPSVCLDTCCISITDSLFSVYVFLKQGDSVNTLSQRRHHLMVELLVSRCSI